MAGKRHFSTELFDFLSELKTNNSREWFQASRERYVTAVQEPLLQFISDFADRLHAISPMYVADPRPTGGSMFRIYRDVRFSKDKSPYKTHAAAQFRHRAGRDAHAPGFYLHLEPGRVFAGAGSWHPAREALADFRNAIVEQPERWTSIIGAPGFRKRHELRGEFLKRPPRGYDADHPLIHDLKRKDFMCIEEFSQAAACRAGFIDKVEASFRSAGPLVQFLTEAVGQDF